MDRVIGHDAAHTGTLPVAGEHAVPVTSAPVATDRQERPEWVDARRAELTDPGRYLFYEDSGQQLVAALTGEWTRIGRSLSADVRFDDATVSRRHALVAIGEEDGVRVLDDRSLNGVFVNGRRVEWSPLADGDEITVGRHTLHYVDTAAVRHGAADPAGAAVSD
jgi:pSer/pThr/pTyr-binding forkhead associated (FHA) protein